MLQRPVFRPDPVGSPGQYKTYVLRQPRDTMIKATCEQVGCEQWARGWDTIIDESTNCGAARPTEMCRWVAVGSACGSCQAHFLRHGAGRTFREGRTQTNLTVFRFESKQRCFTEHQTRPQIYLVRAGDWRQNQGLIRRHVRPGDWVDDFTEHQNRIIERQERG